MAKQEPDFLWTVMVYLAGDNNLTDESVFALTEMKKADRDDRIAVIAQLDPKSSRIPSHRYVISPQQVNLAQAKSGPSDATVAVDAVPIAEPKIRFKDPDAANARTERREPAAGETDTGNPATLFNFISWSSENYRADRYMLILAGHGAGTEEDFLLKDENPTNSLSMRALQQVFEAVKYQLGITIDILGMDVCLMSMAEVCHQLNFPARDQRRRGPFVEYLVSSEGFSPTAGWPYRQILARFQANATAETEDLAKFIVDEYIEFYSDYVVGGLSVDQSVLKVSASTELADAVKSLAKFMKRELRRAGVSKQQFKDALILAHWEAQSYNGELFVDLLDFCQLFATRVPRAQIACKKVAKAIDGLVRKSCYTGVENQFSYGVSIYFPWAEVATSYQDLVFADKADWNSFLDTYVEETRRDPRGFKTGRKRLLDFPGDRTFKFASGVIGPGGFRKSDDRKSDDRGVNPIQSMRNPPVTVVEEGLSECIRKNPSAVRGLKEFSKVSAGR